MKRVMLSALVAAAGTGVVFAAAGDPEVKPATLQPAGATQPAETGKTDKDAKKKVYDENADAKQQIAAALAKAKKENRRVLIQWGGNWCSWCLLLNKTMTTDRSLSKELQYEYDVVHVDAGQPKNKNIDLAKSYGATPDKDGFPFLTILDADGKAIANQESGSLEKKDANGESVLGDGMGHDVQKVLKFLKANEAKPLEAQKVIDAGIAEAKSSEKLVFLHFGAPWCPWCHRLDDWMDKTEPAALLGKGFINVKVDTDRMTGGADVLKKYRPKDGGIPWFAFIDGDGKVVADSDAAKGGNVGFPSAKDELAHFAAMLEKSKLSAEDRTKLIETLKNDKPGTSAGH
ncbi:MAG: thioredoxin family protein [Phycisphaerales bacterium]